MDPNHHKSQKKKKKCGSQTTPRIQAAVKQRRIKSISHTGQHKDIQFISGKKKIFTCPFNFFLDTKEKNDQDK